MSDCLEHWALSTTWRTIEWLSTKTVSDIIKLNIAQTCVVHEQQSLRHCEGRLLWMFTLLRLRSWVGQGIELRTLVGKSVVAHFEPRSTETMTWGKGMETEIISLKWYVKLKTPSHSPDTCSIDPKLVLLGHRWVSPLLYYLVSLLIPFLGYSQLLCVNCPCLLAIVSLLVIYLHHCWSYVWLVSMLCLCDLQQQFLTFSLPLGFAFMPWVHMQLQSSITLGQAFVQAQPLLQLLRGCSHQPLLHSHWPLLGTCWVFLCPPLTPQP